ncbi:unnamed protein product [Cunninghamella blakesleeana]
MMLGETTNMDYSLPGVLHYLQAEWRRFERERNEWTIERAELKAHIALLEGERRGVENLKMDLVKRVKMLEYALRQERKRYLNSNNKTSNVYDDKVQIDLPDISTTSQNGPISPLPSVNSNSMNSIKNREKGRQALKTCLQEINYLTSLPSKLPLGYPLSNSPKNQVNRIPSSSSLSPTSPNNVVNQNQFMKATNYKYNNNNKLQNNNNSNNRIHSGNINRTDSPILSSTNNTNNTLKQSELESKINESNSNNSDQFIEKQQPPSPPDLTNNVDEIAMLDNVIDIETKDGSLIMPTSNDKQDKNNNKSINEDDGDKLTKKMQETYNLSDEKVQKIMKSANKTFKRKNTRSGSPDPQELDLTFDLNDSSVKNSSTDEQTTKLWKTKMTFKGHLDSVRSVAFHPDELLVASGSDDGTIKIIKLQGSSNGGEITKKPHEDLDAITTYRGHHNIITHLAISSEQNRVYSSSLDSTIRVWRLPTDQHGPFSPVDPSLYITTFIGHTDAIWDFKLSPHSSHLLASASADGKIKIWDTEGSDQLLKRSWDYDGILENESNSSSNHKVSPTCVDFCRTDPSKLIVSYNNAKIKLFDIETGKLILQFSGSDEHYDNTCKTQINKIVSHPTSPLIISGHEDRYIRFYDIHSGKSTFNMSAHLDAVTCLDMDPSGTSFISGGHDCSIRLWDLAMTKNCIQEFSAHRKKGDEGVLDVQYHPSYPWMVSGGADGIVKIYNHGH